MSTIDKSLLAWTEREKLLRSNDFRGYNSYLVWINGPKGVFGSCQTGYALGENGILGGEFAGLLWWPQKFE